MSVSDYNVTPHIIQVEVGHPSEVDEIFDNISYNKGASVIRMLYNWIGDLGPKPRKIIIIFPVFR